MGLIRYNGQPTTSNAALYTANPVPLAGLAVTGSTTGGTFAAGTYYWKVTAVNAYGETTGSNEVTATLTGSTGSAALTWTAPPAGTTGVKVYRGTAAGAENVLVATLGNVAAYTDTGTGSAATTPGTIPTALQAAVTIPVKKIVAINATTAAVTLTLTVRRALSGTIENVTTPAAVVISAGSAYSLVEDRLLALDEIVLDPGDALWGFASTGSAVTVVAFE